jgi:hypothetical protein
MIGAVVILILAVFGVVSLVVLGNATQEWARRVSRREGDHKEAPTGQSPAGL